MAIKRSSKSRGTPLRKPAATAALRRIDVLPRQQMLPGQPYVGWLCKNRACGQIIAIASPPSAGKGPSETEDALTAIKCPHCGNEDLYRWSARGEHSYGSKAAEPTAAAPQPQP